MGPTRAAQAAPDWTGVIPFFTLPHRPKWKLSSHRRQWARYFLVKSVVCEGNKIIVALSVLFAGDLNAVDAWPSLLSFCQDKFGRIPTDPSLFSPAVVESIRRFIWIAARTHVTRLSIPRREQSARLEVTSSGNQQATLEALLSDNTLMAGVYSSQSGAKLVPIIADRISLPKLAGTLNVLDALPPDLASFYSDPRNLLKKEPVVATSPSRPYVGATSAQLHALYRRMRGVGMLSFILATDAVVQNGIFAVEKPKDPNEDRCIFDGRRTNDLFVKPPHVRLPQPDDFTRLETNASCPVFGLGRDLESYYFRLLMPESFWPYFSLPPCPAKVFGEDVVAMFGGSDVMIAPCFRVLPMGWSFSVAISQAVHEFITRNTMFGRLRCVTDHTSTALGVGRKSIFIDDANALVADWNFGLAMMAELETVYLSWGLDTKPSKAQQGLQITIIGLEWDGTPGVHMFYPSPAKMFKLLQATHYFTTCGFITGKGLSRLVGYWTWFLLLRRPVLSILNACFAFLRLHEHNPQPQRIWKTVRSELLMLTGVAALLFARTGARVFSKIICTDASPVGGGVMAAPVTAPVRAALSSWMAQSPSSALNTLTAQSLPTLIPHWNHMFSYHFRWSDHINPLEMRMLYNGALWASSHRQAIGARVPMVTDSQVCLFVAAKGRTSAKKLIYPCRRLAAIILFSGITLSCFYISSADNPADFWSRHPRYDYPDVIDTID